MLRLLVFVLLAVPLGASSDPAAASDSTALPLPPFEHGTASTTGNAIDAIVFSRLLALGIQPALPASDAVFLRRAFLDVIGTLPTAAETREFLQDKNPDKRTALIDRLLAREE